jgi:predicted nucleic acid-binding Zn ribbon protein
MTKNCPNCGKKIEEDSRFCDKCGTEIKNTSIITGNESFTQKNKIPLIIIGATAVLVILFLIISPSAIPNGHIFELEGEPTQSVDVDGIFLRIPKEFRLDPSSFDIRAENAVLSSTESWVHETEHIGLMVMRVPASPNMDYSSVLGAGGGVPKNMYGYDGYYIEDDYGYSFAFAKDNRLCVIMVSSYYLFDKITIE